MSLACGAAPSQRRGRVRQQQVLAEHVAADRRQVDSETAILNQCRADRVDDEAGSLPHHLQQADRAAEAGGIELQRVGRVALDAAHDDVDLLQAFERLQVDEITDGPEVVALDQQVAEIAREVGVAEVVLVVRAGCQQGDARVRALALRDDAGLHLLEERGDAARVGGLEQIAGDVGMRDAVGERRADAGRRLGVAVDDAPAAGSVAGEVDGVELQVPGLRMDALAGAQEGRIGQHQRGRDQAVAQKPLRAVDVGQDGVEQARTLRQRLFQPAPLARADDQRHQIDGPALVRRARVGEDVVGDTDLMHALVEAARAAGDLVAGEPAQRIDERAPVLADGAVGREHLVVYAGGRQAVAAEQVGGGGQRARCEYAHDVWYPSHGPLGCDVVRVGPIRGGRHPRPPCRGSPPQGGAGRLHDRRSHGRHPDTNRRHRRSRGPTLSGDPMDFQGLRPRRRTRTGSGGRAPAPRPAAMPAAAASPKA